MTERDQAPGERARATEPRTDEAEIAVAGSGAYFLVVARFRDPTSAAKAYEELRAIEQRSTLAIDGVVVAHRDADGRIRLEQLTEHSTKSGLKWGVVGGIALAALFPPTLLAGALGGGAIGAAAGKVRNRIHRSQVEKELENALTPGSSGILALVEDKALAEIQRSLVTAEAIVARSVDRAVAMEIDAEAKAAKQAVGV